ncbi:hypothetical protein LGM46_29620 [Burkholderia arboris]|uniref:defense against restriction DarA-related protein n=1 Tax=Burkholderia arboris TaxID=488730 RepID=UPI001CF3B595|nr:hypothetical protein [Burkholderia arboris]MCA8037130.1 hypothetical protein [Burkholderia arboris]
MKNLIFDFYNLSGSDAATRTAKRYFLRAGAQVTSVDVDATTKKIGGVEYREVQFGFADSQNVRFGVTASGDVAQVQLNGKPFPIKAQDDHVKAIAEIVSALDRGRKRFQAKLARVPVKLPPSIRTAVPNVERQLREQLAAVDESIDAAKQRLWTLQARAESLSAA